MASNRIYEEYEPATEWSHTPEADAVKLSLPGFKREEIRVLVDNHGHLRTRGERPIAGSGNRWSRFQKDFELPANCNADGIRAKFENERLTITLPKNAASLPMPMPAPPRRPQNMAAPPQMPPPASAPPAVPEQGLRPTAPPPTVPPAQLAPAPSVKPPVEPRPSMPRKPYAPPAPAPAPAPEHPATTKPQPSPLAAVQRPKDEEEKQRERETEGKMAEDRKEMARQKATEPPQQQEEAMPGEMALANQPRPASASRALLVNLAVAVVVLLGITIYVWNSLKNATGGAGEHGHHGHLGAGSYGDEM